MVAEILQHIVQRPEDYLENIENIVKLYKEIILHPLEVRTRYIVKNRNTDTCVLSLVKELSHFSSFILSDSLLLNFDKMLLE